MTHAGLEGSEVIARTQQILTEHRDQLVQGILAIERRMASPETQQQEGLIERLTPICRAGEAIVRSLRELMNQGGALRQR